ncbi:MAG: DUF2934 domain-containing protein [Azospirillaceae bacterium]|nr:DUF2934 domain-containing protein [Azospirillaceae bacterium]
MTESQEERIRKRAYEIWEREGFPSGREAIHWSVAVREIGAEDDHSAPASADQPADDVNGATTVVASAPIADISRDPLPIAPEIEAPVSVVPVSVVPASGAPVSAAPEPKAPVPGAQPVTAANGDTVVAAANGDTVVAEANGDTVVAAANGDAVVAAEPARKPRAPRAKAASRTAPTKTKADDHASSSGASVDPGRAPGAKPAKPRTPRSKV